MALFQQKPEEQKLDWAGLPSEPLDPADPAEALAPTPVTDPSAVSLGTQTTSMVVPVVLPGSESDTAPDGPSADARV